MEILAGDIFNSRAQTLINTVNCVGIMEKGIAAEFKKRYPKMFKDYVIRCQKGEVKQGVPYLFKSSSLFAPQVINFPTKGDWRAASHVEDIEKGLKILVLKYKEWWGGINCSSAVRLWQWTIAMGNSWSLNLQIPLKTGYTGQNVRPIWHAVRTIDR